jgi:hypothetical protein
MHCMFILIFTFQLQISSLLQLNQHFLYRPYRISFVDTFFASMLLRSYLALPLSVTELVLASSRFIA